MLTVADSAWSYDSDSCESIVDAVVGDRSSEAEYELDDLLRNVDVSETRVTTSSGNQALRIALNKRVIYVDSIADMQVLDTSRLVNGQQVAVKGYHAGSALGGGMFFWDVDSTESVNGGIIFGSHVTGRFKRVASGPLCATDFGAIPGDKATGSNAFSRMPPGEYLIRHDIHTNNVTWSGDGYAISTTADSTITVDGGVGLFSINGNFTKVPYINLVGRLEVGGANSGNRAVGVYVGVANIDSYSSSPAFRAQWASEIKVEHVDIHLLGGNDGNQGVAFAVLKNPDIGFFRVTGNISLGYQFIGNSTVGEPTIDGGNIGTLIADKNSHYNGVENGHHGCYLKGCRSLTVNKIEVYGNGDYGWKTNGEYHIKLRDNQMCVFNALCTHDSGDKHSLGSIFITSDGNTLPPMVENYGNLYSNVLGYTVAYVTPPGVNKNCTIHNIKGAFQISSENVSGWLVTGSYSFHLPSLKIFNNFEFNGCVIDVPSCSGNAHFVRPVKARNCTFLQGLRAHNTSILYLDSCRVLGDIELDGTYGEYECNISNSSATGSLLTNSYGARLVTANISNAHFDSDEPSTSYQPTIRNYRCVSFGSRVYLNENITTDDLSYR